MLHLFLFDEEHYLANIWPTRNVVRKGLATKWVGWLIEVNKCWVDWVKQKIKKWLKIVFTILLSDVCATHLHQLLLFCSLYQLIRVAHISDELIVFVGHRFFSQFLWVEVKFVYEQKYLNEKSVKFYSRIVEQICVWKNVVLYWMVNGLVMKS